jgi:predicted Zn-dependent protease
LSRIRIALSAHLARYLSVLLFAVICGCATIPGEDPDAPKVYLVPLGDYPTASAESLAKYVQEKSGVATVVLPSVALPRRVVDHQRKQIVAEELGALIAERYSKLLGKPKKAIIGLTQEDMYIQQADWRFAFAARPTPSIAIISNWRMNPENLSQPKDDKRLNERLKKMLIKNVGILVSQHPENDDPKSAFYRGIRSVDDLDAIQRDF